MMLTLVVCLLVLTATVAPPAEASPKHYLIQTADGANGAGGESEPSLSDNGATGGKKIKKKGEDFF
jgi:hypothetical protein